jgi:sporulation protein YlmC with PRC-barrel domain
MDIHILSAKTMIGNGIKNLSGETLGKLEDLMLSAKSGRVSYAVLSFGGFLGLGNKLFAVPWPALDMNSEEKCFYLDIEKKYLENAPGFDGDHWPNLADPEWSRSIHDYYGIDPYW